MLLQWQEELSSRFGLGFEILDKDYIRKVRRERGSSVNPWTTHSRFLISQRLLVDETCTAGLRDWLGNFRPGTLFILDEAHHAAPASGQKYAIGSQITHAVRGLAHRFEHRLFLSATPHNGHSNSFWALLEILDPQRFIRGVPVSKHNRDDVMVRRIKDDLREIQGGFPKRHVEQITLRDLPHDAPELQLARLLSEYQEAREQRVSGESKRVQSVSGLLMCNLQQRLFSSIEAFARTLRVHRQTVERQRQPAPPKPAGDHLKLDLLAGGVDPDDDRAELAEAELAAEVEEQVEAATAAAHAPAEQSGEDRLLQEMAALSDASRRIPDARVRYLSEWIANHMCPEGRWNATRIIVFTEYEDTLRYLEQQLR